jgi:hypothetical protein
MGSMLTPGGFGIFFSTGFAIDLRLLFVVQALVRMGVL